ncbi:MAG: ABC transporter ATP-binding protein [Lachnospiraceae bacterium]
MANSVRVKSVTKNYGEFVAIPDLSVDIGEGEFFTLLGPSGCGKTTLLRMIAGFNDINSGEICFGDRVINNLSADKRDIGMVFQNYAIFPHLTIKQNVEYGLRARKIKGEELERRTSDAMKLMHIDEQKDKYPQQLSGGQQQRVALARAVVIEPSVLLMDEPLSNLDAKLRVEMRMVIRAVQKKLNITTIYVTHDQEEALSVSDRIAIMNKGRIAQLGTPYEIYARPANQFVADFIGTSSFLKVTIRDRRIFFPGKQPLNTMIESDYSGEAILSVRPETVMLVEQSESELCGIVKTTTFLGDSVCYMVTLETGEELTANQYMNNSNRIHQADEPVGVRFLEERLNLFDRTGEEALL